MSDVNDPSSPDYIEDYDFFEVKRKERLELIQRAKVEIDKRHRIEVKRKALAWRADGTKVFENLRMGMLGVKALLEPHSNTKKTVNNFVEHMDQLNYRIRGKVHTRHMCTRSSQVLQLSRQDPEKHIRWFRNKANLIEWKFHVMQEIRAAFKFSHSREFEFREMYTHVRVLRHIFRMQMNNIPIDRNISEELKKKRANYKVVKTKLKLIRDTAQACASIPLCKSRQHTNPKGCSSCGVVYMGGMLGGGVQYVQSISRETGLSSLVTLEYEVETLKKEDIIQTEIVEIAEVDLFAYESVVLDIVRVNIQAWWPVVLAWKRYKRRQKRMQKSLYRNRIRRLVKMKRDVDMRIKEAAPIDMVQYGDIYCDILPALCEYVALVSERKHQRMIKCARHVRSKLKVLVEETRERKYKEYLRLLALPKPPRPLVLLFRPSVRSRGPIPFGAKPRTSSGPRLKLSTRRSLSLP